MIYIDFTSPEGKTYRIDVSEHPVHFECPVCGDITVYTFEEDPGKYCYFCMEKQQQQEKEEMDARLYRQLAGYLNRERKCHITPEEAKRLVYEPEFRNTFPGVFTPPNIRIIPGRR